MSTLMRILHLNIYDKPFEVMKTGEKTREYREPTAWIKSRLIDRKTKNPKDIDFVKVINGYGNDKPYFIAKYLGFEISKYNYRMSYTNNLVVHVRKGMFRILIGDVVEVGNVIGSQINITFNG